MRAVHTRAWPMSAPRSTRLGAALLVWAFSVSNLAALIHEATTTHTRCPEHGELVHGVAVTPSVDDAAGLSAGLGAGQPPRGRHRPGRRAALAARRTGPRPRSLHHLVRAARARGRSRADRPQPANPAPGHRPGGQGRQRLVRRPPALPHRAQDLPADRLIIRAADAWAGSVPVHARTPGARGFPGARCRSRALPIARAAPPSRSGVAWPAAPANAPPLAVRRPQTICARSKRVRVRCNPGTDKGPIGSPGIRPIAARAAGQGVALGLGLWLAVGAVTLPGGSARAGAPVHTLTLSQAVQLALAHNPDSQSADEDVRARRGRRSPSRAPSTTRRCSSSSLGREPVALRRAAAQPVRRHLDHPDRRQARAPASPRRAPTSTARGRPAVASRRQLALAGRDRLRRRAARSAQLDFARQDQAGLHQAERHQRAALQGRQDRLRRRAQAAHPGARRRRHGAPGRAGPGQRPRRAGAAGAARACWPTTSGRWASLAPPTATRDLSAAPSSSSGPWPNRTRLPGAARRRAQRAGRRRGQAERQPIPDLDVLFDYNRVPDEAGSYDVSAERSAIPLFDRNRGAIRQAEAAAARRALATEQPACSAPGRRRARRSRRWQHRQARLALYDEELLSAAKESLDISRHAYEQGRGSLLDYLDAEASYREVRERLPRGGGRRHAGRRAASASLPGRTRHEPVPSSLVLLAAAACARRRRRAHHGHRAPRGRDRCSRSPRPSARTSTVVKAARKPVARPVVGAGAGRLRRPQDQRGDAAGQRQGHPVLVHEGDHVKVGQPLLTIASPDSSDNAANLARDRSELRTKQTILARDKDLYEHKAISLEELQQASSTSSRPRPRSRTTRPTWRSPAARAATRVLRSPIAGRRGRAQGRGRRRGLGGSHRRASRSPIPPPVWVVEPALPGGPAPGRGRRHRPRSARRCSTRRSRARCIYVGASIDPDTLTIPVRVAAENPSGLLKKGMYVDAEIIPTTPRTRCWCRSAAVLRDADNLPFVYVQEQPGAVRPPARRSRRPGR